MGRIHRTLLESGPRAFEPTFQDGLVDQCLAFTRQREDIERVARYENLDLDDGQCA